MFGQSTNFRSVRQDRGTRPGSLDASGQNPGTVEWFLTPAGNPPGAAPYPGYAIFTFPKEPRMRWFQTQFLARFLPRTGGCVRGRIPEGQQQPRGTPEAGQMCVSVQPDGSKGVKMSRNEADREEKTLWSWIKCPVSRGRARRHAPNSWLVPSDHVTR